MQDEAEKRRGVEGEISKAENAKDIKAHATSILRIEENGGYENAMMGAK